jgi:hypothetical protein
VESKFKLEHPPLVTRVLEPLINAVIEVGGYPKDVFWIETDKELRSALAKLIIKHARPDPVIEIYPVSVDYSQSTEQMVRAGQYDAADRRFDSIEFPIRKREGDKELKGIHYFELAIIDFPRRNLTTEAAKKLIMALGFQPAKIEHLLALGAMHKEIQRKYNMIALCALKAHGDGDVAAACLFQDEKGKRCLYTQWQSAFWQNMHFIGYRESNQKNN